MTGATGFVGRWAVAELSRRGAHVGAVSRTAGRVAGVDTFVCDLLVPAEARRVVTAFRPDVVLHLAWFVEHGRFWNAPENIDWVAASLQLFRAARDAGVTRVVGVGTCFEYDWPAHSDCDEASTPIRPTTLYAVSKDAVRRICEEWNAFSFAWARLFYLYGPAEHPDRLVASIAGSLARGEEARLSSGFAVRDYMRVEDAGAALAMLALSQVSGCVNIASGQGRSIRDIAETLARAAGREDLLCIGALPDRSGDPPRIVGSIQRLGGEVGFAPAMTIEEGLRDACRRSLSREREDHE